MSDYGGDSYQQIGTAQPLGVTIGKSSTDSKVAFFQATPISMRTTVAIGSIDTTAATSTATYYAFSTNTGADELVAQVNEITATIQAYSMHA